MKVSIIMPVFNGEKHILKTLISLEKQTNKNFELIIVDDGSKDKTKEIIKEFKKTTNININYFYKDNSGVSDARNYGIENSIGEYIIFLDSDDFLNIKAIEKIKKKLITNPEIIMYGFNRVNNDINKPILNFEELSICPLQKNNIEIIDLILRKKIKVHTASICYSKKLLKNNKIEFPSRFLFSEDYHFIIKAIFHAKNIIVINEVLAYWNYNVTSLTNTFNIRRFDAVKSFQKLYEYLKQNGCENDLLSFMKEDFIQSHFIEQYFVCICKNPYSYEVLEQEIIMKYGYTKEEIEKYHKKMLDGLIKNKKIKEYIFINLKIKMPYLINKLNMFRKNIFNN